MPVYTNSLLNGSAEGATSSLENQTAATVSIVSTAAAGWPLDGTKSYSVVATAATTCDARVRLVERPASAAGKRWHLRAKLRAHSGNTGTRRFQAFILSYTGSGATLGTATTVATGPALDVAPGSVVDIILTGVAAAGAVTVGAIFRRTGDLSAAVGDGFHLDMLALVQADDVDPVGLSYYNPDLVPFARWNGAANASTSTLWVPKITLDPFTDEDPSPRVQVVVSDLPPAATHITLRRDADEESSAIVRDANRVPLSGAFVVTDLEVGLGIATTYTAELFAGSVPLGVSLGYVTTVPVLDPLAVYIHDPLDPRTVVKGTVGDAFGQDMGKNRDAAFHTPGGASSGSVLLAGPLEGYSGINLEFYTDDRPSSRAFRELRDQTPIAVLRTAAPIPVPRTLYVAVLDPRSELLIPQEGFTRWQWTSRQVIAPTIGVIIPLHSYADYMAFYPSYQAAMAAFTTYLDAILNPPPAV